MKLNRECKVCGEKYSYCPTCDKDKFKPQWYSMFHDENCKNIFNTLVNQTVGKITIEEAYELISTYDLSNLDKFDIDIKNQIETIMNTNKKENKIEENGIAFDNIITKKTKIRKNKSK